MFFVEKQITMWQKGSLENLKLGTGLFRKILIMLFIYEEIYIIYWLILSGVRHDSWSATEVFISG